jgi:hypothetical protein
MIRPLRFLAILASAAGMLATAAHGQQSPAACPSTKTLDELIHAIDEAVSGPANKDRTCFRAIMLPDTRLIPVSKAKDGTIQPHVLSVQDWIDRVGARGTAVFYEKQVSYKTQVYGQIAHLFSTYETRSTPDGKADVRGINSIQAINDGQSWHIQEIIWQAETPDNPVPKEYMP